jgi:TonB family protein
MGSKSIKVVKADAQSKTDAATAQTSKQRPFDVVEHMPEYPGGASALFEFLSKTVKYPAAAEKAGTQGRVVVTFVVEQDGSIAEPTVVKSVSPELDAEAVRVINAMPNWKPGTQNGKAVRVKYTVPISFALQGGRSTSKIDDKGNPEGKNVLGPLVIVGYDKTSTTELETAPLVIVDGKTVDYSQLKTVDTNTISHMEVLKDKASIEKFGDKAKNGVILITTKK